MKYVIPVSITLLLSIVLCVSFMGPGASPKLEDSPRNAVTVKPGTKVKVQVIPSPQPKAPSPTLSFFEIVDAKGQPVLDCFVIDSEWSNSPEGKVFRLKTNKYSFKESDRVKTFYKEGFLPAVLEKEQLKTLKKLVLKAAPRIFGTVTMDQNPLHYAKVTVGGPLTPVIQRLIAAKCFPSVSPIKDLWALSLKGEGHSFSCEIPALGPITVIAEAEGLTTASQVVKAFTIGEERHVDMKLVGECRITGVVASKQGPAVNAHVSLYPIDDETNISSIYTEGTTDEAGTFDLRKIPVGKYLLYVSSFGVGQSFVIGQEIDLREPGRLDLGTLTAPTQSVSGRVLKPNGEGLAGAEITGHGVGSAFKHLVYLKVKTDAEGRYEICANNWKLLSLSLDSYPKVYEPEKAETIISYKKPYFDFKLKGDHGESIIEVQTDADLTSLHVFDLKGKLLKTLRRDRSREDACIFEGSLPAGEIRLISQNSNLECLHEMTVNQRRTNSVVIPESARCELQSVSIKLAGSTLPDSTYVIAKDSVGQRVSFAVVSTAGGQIKVPVGIQLSLFADGFQLNGVKILPLEGQQLSVNVEESKK